MCRSVPDNGHSNITAGYHSYNDCQADTKHSMLVHTKGSEGMLARQEQLLADCDITRPSNSGSTAS